MPLYFKGLNAVQFKVPVTVTSCNTLYTRHTIRRIGLRNIPVTIV